jgi:hypothetical protein
MKRQQRVRHMKGEMSLPDERIYCFGAVLYGGENSLLTADRLSAYYFALTLYTYT